MRVLIVEDGALDRAVLAALLARRGHEITEVEDGRRAWELLQRESFPLVFTDLRLPGMDGLELLGRVATLAEHNRPHTVVITASSRPEDLREALDRGAHDYLLKTAGAGALDVRVAIAEQAAQLRLQQQRGERLQRALYRISEAASSSDSPQELFASIHAAIEDVLATPNFYIAMFEPGTGQLEYRYWVSERGRPPQDGERGRSLAEYVLRTGQTLIAPPEVQARLEASGEAERHAGAPAYWVGVPLMRRQHCFGVLGTFSFSDALSIGKEEADVLGFVSEQAAAAIERKRAEEALRRSERMAAMGGLVAGVAHEIRNPLFGLTAAMDTLERRYSSDVGDLGRYLDAMREQLSRVTSLMQDLLEYGKPYQPALARQSLEPIVSEAAAAVEALAREREVAVELSSSPDLPVGLADRGRLVQVFRNLLDNAIRHSPRGGRVEVALFLKEEGTPRLVCSVRDSGPGFPEDELARVFEPFYTRRRGGTGLGLAIAQRVAEEHGGAVRVRNAAGGGGLVEVSLPVA